MKRSPTIEALVQRGLTKARADVFAAESKVRAEAAVEALLTAQVFPHRKAIQARAALDAVVDRLAELDGALPVACRLSAMSKRMVPDAVCGDGKAAAEAAFKPKRRAA